MATEWVEKEVTAKRPCPFDKVLHGEEEVEGDQTVGGTLEGVQATQEKVFTEKAN